MNNDESMNNIGLGVVNGYSQGGMIGGIVGGGMAIVKDIYSNGNYNQQQIDQQRELNNLQIQGNRQLMDYQNQLQYDMWLKTNYSAQVDELKKAGLNPALMYKGAAGGGVTGTTTQGGVSGGHASDEAARINAKVNQESLGLQRQMAIAQIRNMEADTNLKNTNAEKTAGVDTRLGEANISNLAASTNNKEIEGIGIEIDNRIKTVKAQVAEATQEQQIEMANAELNKINAQTRQIELNNEITEGAKADIIAQIGLQVDNLRKDLKVKDSEIKNKNADTEKKKADTDERIFLNSEQQRQLRTMLQQNDVKKKMAEAGITQEELMRYIESGIAPNTWTTGVLTMVDSWIRHITNSLNLK